MTRYLMGAVLAGALLSASAATAQSAAKKVTAAPGIQIQEMPIGAPAARPAGAVPQKEAAEGTFQLVRLTPKYETYITSDALAEIERRRQDNDEVSWIISPYAKVRILPRRVINAPDFRPIEPIADAKPIIRK